MFPKRHYTKPGNIISLRAVVSAAASWTKHRARGARNFQRDMIRKEAICTTLEIAHIEQARFARHTRAYAIDAVDAQLASLSDWICDAARDEAIRAYIAGCPAVIAVGYSHQIAAHVATDINAGRTPDAKQMAIALPALVALNPSGQRIINAAHPALAMAAE